MGLLIIKGRDGKPRPTWYGRISVKGKRRDANLGVPIEGTIPMSDQGAPVWTVKGDAAFERSKRTAQKAFEKWRKETQKDPAELAAKAYHARTGVSVEGVPLANLADLWETQKRTYTPIGARRFASGLSGSAHSPASMPPNTAHGARR